MKGRIKMFLILIIIALIFAYTDYKRVGKKNSPIFTVKIISDGGNKLTYLGLGYKITAYAGVSPHEPFKMHLANKMGSWFMNYKLNLPKYTKA